MKPISAPPTQPPKQPARARLEPIYPNEGWPTAVRVAARPPRSSASRRVNRRRGARQRATALDPAVAELLTLFPFARAIRGRLGDIVFKTYGRKIIVTRAPSFAGYVPTAAQRTRRDRMREATAYAQRVYADAVAKAFYTAAAKTLGRQPFRLAVSDYLRAHARVAIVTALWASAATKPAAPISPVSRRQPHRAPTQVARRNTGDRNSGVSDRKFHRRQTEDGSTTKARGASSRSTPRPSSRSPPNAAVAAVSRARVRLRQNPLTRRGVKKGDSRVRVPVHPAILKTR